MAVSIIVGLDNGGTSNNATVLRADGHFLIDTLVETPSRVQDGPDAAIEALIGAFDQALNLVGATRQTVQAIGLDSPGPASAEGVISSKGSTNFSHPGWYGFDFRGELERRIAIPVFYNNDGNAAARYAHQVHFGNQAPTHSSISAIIGTGLGGGLIELGRVIKGAAGMAGEIGHIEIPMPGLLEVDQSIPSCNCGLEADAESIASLTAIGKNLLPYWLTRYEGHELGTFDIAEAAKRVRGYAESGDPMALDIFRQQAMALGRLFSIASNFLDPHAYFVGGGVVESSPSFRGWFLEEVKNHTTLRKEQAEIAIFALIPDLDMAGARGAALGAMDALGMQ